MTSGDFQRWNAFREREEGGWSDDPNDSGGETKYGISKRSYPDLDIAALTREGAAEIAKRDYWDVVRGDELPWPLNFVLADWSFNAGVSRAIGGLQAEIGLEVDGKPTEMVFATAWRVANQIGAQALSENVHLRRVSHFVQIVRGNPSQLKFLGGWWNRTVRLAYLMGG